MAVVTAGDAAGDTAVEVRLFTELVLFFYLESSVDLVRLDIQKAVL